MVDEMHRAPVRQGEVLSGRYRVERVLGVGGMGVVVAATHLQLEQRVAIKFLLPHALAHPEVVERFAREARAAVRIQSEHVARVMDVGALADGAPFMVMEYLEGRDLAALVQARGPLPVEAAVDFVLQACEAIAEAHRLGIVHRDLKPSNLFLVEGRGVGAGVVKVLDFGISKATGLGGAAGAGMTQSASILGSPLYMSPEQMESARDVDARTDIWAMGAILHELLTGTTPFTGDSIPQLCMAISQKSPKPLRALRPDAPEGLERVVLRCLEKDRTRRFASVHELAIGLAPFAPARSHLSLERIGALVGAGPAASLTLSVPGSSPGETPAEVIGVGSRYAPHLGLGGANTRAERSRGSTQSAWGNTASVRRARSRRWAAAAIVVVGALGFVTAQIVRMVNASHAGLTGQGVSSAGSGALPPRSAEPPPKSDFGAEAPTALAPTVPPVRTLETSEPPPTSSVVTDSTRRLAPPRRPAPGVAASSQRQAPPAKPRASEAWEDER